MDLQTVPFEYLAAWPVLVFALMVWDRRFGRLPLCIVYSYIAGLAVNHWFGGLVHLYPTDASEYAMVTEPGFALTTWGLVFLVLGAAVFPRGKWLNPKRPQTGWGKGEATEAGRVVNCLILMGLACWVIELTPLANVPSLGSVISGGKQLLIGAICLKCWLAWIRNDRRALLFWLAVGFALPLYTMLVLGFLGYGIGYLLSILIFVGTFYRPRWRVIAAGVIGIYAGLSVYVGYVENRAQIRDAVWGGESMEARIDAASNILHDLTPFDPTNPQHQHLIDERLNQNWLVGASMNYVPEFRPYAYGATLYIAAISLVPRAIWPDKPFSAGSGDLVSQFTGFQFAENTSVGIGQVMEFYINFGWAGVAAGFFVLGLVLRYIDLRVSTSIRDRAWSEAGLWFAIGLSAMQQIGQLAEITSSIAGAAVFGLVAIRFARSSLGRRRPQVAIPARVSGDVMPVVQQPGARWYSPPGRPNRQLP